MRFLFFLVLVLPCLAGLVNKNVVRVIDIQGDTVFVRLNLTLECTGSPAHSFQLPVEYPISKISYFFPTVNGVTELEYSLSSQTYDIKLPTPLNPDTTQRVSVVIVLTHVVQPLPVAVPQDKSQLVKYFDNHFLFSPYPTKEQILRIVTHSQKVEDYTKSQGVYLQGDTLVSGPHHDIAPNSHKEVMIHFDDMIPFATVTSSIKEMIVSHYYGVSTEEHYYLENSGAKLDGFFSRYDMQMRRVMTPYAIMQLRCSLPLFSHTFYYRDAIGNISTSLVNYTDKSVDLDISPRFLLFGGWKIDFQVGFTTPLAGYMLSGKEKKAGKPAHQLVVPTAPTMQSVVVDVSEVRIALPEGARNILVEAPHGVEWELSTEKTFGLLDIFGRPTVVLRSRNVLPQLAASALIFYDYSSLRLLLKPLWVVLYGVFAAGLVCCWRFLVRWLGSAPHPRKE